MGLSTLDIAYDVDSYPTEDTKTQASDQFMGAGGPAANAAVTYAALSRQSPTLITALGTHQLSGIVRSDLLLHNVKLIDTTPSSSQQPPVSSIVVARRSETRTIVSLDASQIHARYDDSLARHVITASVVLIDAHYPELAIGIAQAASNAHVPVVLDAGRWKDVHRSLLPFVDVAICSSAFAPPGSDIDDPETVVNRVHSLGPKLVAITRGSKPILFSNVEQTGKVEIRHADAIDTLGAGDILHGAFCYYSSHGHGFVDSLRLAADIATTSCQYFGTRQWHATLNDLPA